MRKWLRTLPGRVAEGALVAAVLALGGWALGILDTSVPLWVIAAALAVAVPPAFAAGRMRGRATPENLERYYAEHVREVLETLQKALIGGIPGVTVRDYIERGILAPARHWLTRRPGEDVRLSIIVPDDQEREFRLEYEAGHSLEARKKFTLSVAGSFAGFAYSTGETQWTNDVERDDRWTAHPLARPQRRYGSLVSVPIRAGNQVVGVFNVLSTEAQAFAGGDLAYVEVLGSLINVAYSLMALRDGTPDTGG